MRAAQVDGAANCWFRREAAIPVQCDLLRPCSLYQPLASVAAVAAAAVAAARRPNARADVLPPSGKLTRSRSDSGPSRRSQDFSTDYSSGPVESPARPTFRGLASASAEALRAELELIYVSLLARVERGACARPRARQNQRSATHTTVQRLYVCVAPCEVRRVGGARLMSPRM